MSVGSQSNVGRDGGGGGGRGGGRGGGGGHNAEPGRETGQGVTSVTHAQTDEALVALAATQHLVFSLDQLRHLGFTAAGVRKRLARHRLHRIHQSVYGLVPSELLTRNGRYMAAVLACGPGAVLSHRSAAVLHGLKDWGATNIEVTVPRRSRLSRPGILVHQSKALLPHDITVVDGIPCTSLARTLLDLADVVNRRGVEIAFDRADQQDKLDLGAVEAQIERNPTRAAVRRVRSVLATHYIGSAPTDSELEEAALALCRRLTIPMPHVQRWLILPDGGPALRPDFTWPAQKVILEADGDKVHGTRQARELRNLRDQRLLVQGWIPLHASWRQVSWRPGELGPRLVALLKQRLPPPAPPRAAAG